MTPLFSGKYAVLMILVVALAATIGSSLYLAGLQKEPIGLWGRDAAVLIVQSPKWEALELTRASDKAAESLHVDGTSYFIARRRDLDVAAGASNLRSSLMVNRSFDWNTSTDNCEPEWRWGLRFHGEANDATVLFAPNCGTARLLETGRQASMAPRMDAIDRFMREQFPAEKAKK